MLWKYDLEVSVDIFVFLRKDRLNSTAESQARLDDLGIDLQLGVDAEPATHTGYWPSVLEGTPTGFEFYATPTHEGFAQTPPPSVGDRDYVANFVTHSDMRELKCGMLAAACLAIAAQGVAFDEETMSGEDLLEQARAIQV